MLVVCSLPRAGAGQRWILFLLVAFHCITVQCAALAGTVAKSYPGSSNYPSTEDWQALNASISGRLIKFSNPGRVCYGSSFNAGACSRFRTQITNATYVGNNAGLTNWPQYAGDPCPPLAAGTNTPGPADGCAEGKFPTYVVAAQSAEDVATAVKWAGKTGVRVVVKNTGHDFLGRNVGYGALSIWTRHINGLQWHDKWSGKAPSVDVSGKWQGAAVTYGAGHVWADVINAAYKKKHCIVTGAEGTVGGGGGWLQGGGHGPYSNQYGLGVEQVLEFQVVTPTGEIVIANENSNPDLFWALRGGGASTFGIVTRVTYKAYPTPPVTLVYLYINPAKKDDAGYDAFFNAMAYFFSVHPNLTDFGLSGYPVLTKDGYSGALGSPGKTVKEVNQFWAPIGERLKQYGVTVKGTTVDNKLSTFTGNLMEMMGSDPAATLAEVSGYPFAMGSRLLSRRILAEANIPKIAGILKTILSEPNVYLLPYPNMPGIAHENRKWDFALNPAWKSTSMHLINVWNDGVKGGIGKIPGITKRDGLVSTEKVKQMIQLINEKNIPALDELADNHAAYINEASPYEKDWKTTFYGGGQNYERLLAVKRKYDPNNVLWCSPCVGGDIFKEGDDGKLYRT